MAAVTGTGTVKVTPARGVTHANPGPVDRGTGSDRLDVLVKALEGVQLSDQHDLYRAMEAFRMLGHRLAIEGMMLGQELEEGVKAAARQNSVLGVASWSDRAKIKRTLKAFRSMSDSFAAAAAGAVATWSAFERDFADDLSPAKTKPAKRRGFSINLG